MFYCTITIKICMSLVTLKSSKTMGGAELMSFQTHPTMNTGYIKSAKMGIKFL